MTNTAPDTRWQEAAKAVAARNRYAQAAKDAGLNGIKPKPIPQKPVLNSSMPLVKKQSSIPGVAGAIGGSLVNDTSSKALENEISNALKKEETNEK